MARSKAKQAELAAKGVADLVRERALRAIFEHDQELAGVYDVIAEGIRADLRATGFTIAQVREILDKHLSSASALRRQIIEKAIVKAAREARVLPQDTFDAIFGKEAAEQGASPFARRSRPKSER